MRRLLPLLLPLIGCSNSPVTNPRQSRADAETPSFYDAPAGRVSVILTPKLLQTDSAYGTWDWGKRLIRLDKSLSPAARRYTYFHETCHQMLDDAGVKLRSEDEERVCDAIALHRVAEGADR